jgi:hypothetical protein
MPNNGGLSDRRAIASAKKVTANNRRCERNHASNPLLFTEPKKIPRSKRIAAKRMAKSRGVGMPIINPHRKAEKLRMDVLGLKSRKQLRKARKKETKRKAAYGSM